MLGSINVNWKISGTNRLRIMVIDIFRNGKRKMHYKGCA